MKTNTTPGAQGKSTALRCDALVRRLWATSVLQQESPGKLNHTVGYREATSEAEARGLALAAAEELNPTNQLLGVVACEIAQDHIDRMASPNIGDDRHRRREAP